MATGLNVDKLQDVESEWRTTVGSVGVPTTETQIKARQEKKTSLVSIGEKQEAVYF